jgi:hypothetical protein
LCAEIRARGIEIGTLTMLAACQAADEKLAAKHGLPPNLEVKFNAEQRVLKAVADVEQASLEYYVAAFGDETGWGAVSAAELARRGV